MTRSGARVRSGQSRGRRPGAQEMHADLESHRDGAQASAGTHSLGTLMDMSMEDLLVRADRNMAGAWSAILAIAPGSVRREGAGYVSLSCELPVPLFNPTFVLDRPTDPTGFVDAVLAERGAGAALIYSREGVHPGVADAGAARGLVENYQPPLMVLD